MKKAVLFIFLFLCVRNIFADGAKYLIITHDNFFKVIQPLAEWKHKKGVPTKVVKLSEIGGNKPELIKNYISDIYYRWNPRPEYVLLVGDINQISPYPHPACGPTDNPYADVNGDSQIELFLGRLPCRNIPQLKSMINKIFSYERTPYLAETLWYRKVTTVRQDPGPYHNVGVDFVRSIIFDNSDFIQVDTLVAPIHNRQDLKDSIIRGRSYVLYTGHGAGTQWVSPFKLAPAIANNTKKLPVIFSWCCQTVLRLSYLGQRWLKAGSTKHPKGSVAYIGTTTSGLYAPYRNFVARNFFRAIFQHKVLNIGKALKEGLDSLWTYSPDSFGRTLYSEWNLLGDPEMNLWTEVPKSMRVRYESIIPLGQQSFNLSVTTQNGAPIPDASVCIMLPNDLNFYYCGYTDKYGDFTFNINPIIQDTILVTITAQNFIPFEGKCLVASSVQMYYTNPNNNFDYQHDPIFIKPSLIKNKK